jgi:hypothetical protein
MSDDESKLFLSDDAILALVSTLAVEVVRYGEQEAALIDEKKLSEEQKDSIMKANTLLTVFAALLVRIVESEDIATAAKVVDCWISPSVQDMVSIAFANEIEQAAAHVTQGIDDLEDVANKETDETPSQSGD